MGHKIRHKLCGHVLRPLPSTSPSLSKLCQTTISQHKLYSLTTSLTLCSFSRIHNSWHITNADSRLLSLQVHFTVTLCPHDTTHRPKLSATNWLHPHYQHWWCAFIGHINCWLGETNLTLIIISPKICTLWYTFHDVYQLLHVNNTVSHCAHVWWHTGT